MLFVKLMAKPAALIYAVFFFTTPRLYANSLFATLNARQAIRSAHVGANGEVISLKLSSQGSQNNRSGHNVGVRFTSIYDHCGELLTDFNGILQLNQPVVSVNVEQTSTTTLDVPEVCYS
jgi:hypothetical protein